MTTGRHKSKHRHTTKYQRHKTTTEKHNNYKETQMTSRKMKKDK